MTKKDYILIAEIVSNATYKEEIEDSFGPSTVTTCDWTVLVGNLADAFKKENPKFNPSLFLDACEPKK